VENRPARPGRPRTIGRIRGRRVAVAVIAAFLPLILIGNAVHVIAHPWFVGVELDRTGPDPYGMADGDRRRLADTALDSIVPFGGADQVLREARLRGGGTAFDPKERRHLHSVRGYLLGLYAIHAVALAALAALLLVPRTRRLARDGIAAGAAWTLAIAAFVGVYVAVAPVSFLGGFHRFFFSGDSWRFADTETLRRLFPDAFWRDTAVVIGGLVAAQAAVLLAAALARRRQAIRAARRTAAHAPRARGFLRAARGAPRAADGRGLPSGPAPPRGSPR
jgi:hypothetical protein